ncbi:hypothetical protein [Acinetobacter chinensis]|uniref:hypothetical protein n=1 Tax=Acinetobacter chinensis TaxID=2004650 RepID=UPI0029344CBE|nr:hypothetical protein [Acinetobacter chinensis]WOE40655.1 hypothetical protein QSG87_12265 [Acinetobacter chinensis]
MFLLSLIFNNKRWSLIIVLLIFSLWKTWQTNDYAGQLLKAEVNCKTKVEKEVGKALKPYLEAEEQAQKNAHKAGEKYEEDRENERVKTETIYKTSLKVIERPVYINTCFDDDGVRLVNEAGNTSES